MGKLKENRLVYLKGNKYRLVDAGDDDLVEVESYGSPQPQDMFTIFVWSLGAIGLTALIVLAVFLIPIIIFGVFNILIIREIFIGDKKGGRRNRWM